MPAMPPISFTVEDLKHQGRVDADKLERVLRQFQIAIQTPVAPVVKTAAGQTIIEGGTVDLNALSKQVAELVKPQLQATGSSPLNTQNLLPAGSAGGGTTIVGSHADRLSLFPASSYPIGKTFFEVDRLVTYVNVDVGGSLVWLYDSGMFTGAHASHPTDLGGFDAGFLMWIIDYNHIAQWDGVGWFLIGGGGGYFIDSAIALGNGWHLCDGSVTDYIQNNTPDLHLVSFTTPDETSVGAARTTYHRSMNVYSGVVTPATQPILAGTTDSALTGLSAPVGSFDTTTPSADAIVPPVTDPGHAHGLTGVSVSLPDNPVQYLNVLRYFRR